MKKQLIGLGVVAALMACGSVDVNATAIGSGSFELFAPDSAAIRYNYSQNYFGYLDDYNTADRTRDYVSAYLDQPGYIGSASLGASSVTGDWDEDGSAEFTFTATSPSPGIKATASVNFNSYITFYGLLEDFGYDTFYTGVKGSHPDDRLSFVTQMEIGYIPVGGSYTDRVSVYSDYGTANLVDPANNYRTNWVLHHDVENGTYSDSIRFDYSSLGEQNWRIRYDFMGSGVDMTEANPVPEPATMLLFGTGLVGLVGSRLRKKKK